MKEIKRCPHCGTPMQIYPRSIRADQVKALFILYKTDRFMKVSEMKSEISIGAVGDLPKLRFWKLIEGDDKGSWKITIRGRLFIQGHLKVPKYVWTFRNVQVEQPEDDTRENPLISVYDTKFEACTKETSIEDSTPFDGNINDFL